ncbi:MAG TPA: hypothetical protein VHX88_21745 [Solirubrobacteraceae bacterium]|jgi:uncharacterized delta-60 repeat protein|nr:hypothetical protein [Solirubrobacteraceae bacterium]
MPRTVRLLLLAPFAALALAAPAGAETAPGRVTIPAGAQGSTSEARMAMLPLANGSLAVAGLTAAGAPEVAELTGTGALNPSFGSGGIELPAVAMTPTQIVQEPSGDLLVLGSASNGPGTSAGGGFADWELLRLLPSGQPDTTFGPGGAVVLPVQDPGGQAAMQPDGDLVLPSASGPASGGSPATPPPSHAAVARVLPSGHLDASFGGDGMVTLPVGNDGGPAAILPDGTIYAVGEGSTVPREPSALMRLTVTGSLDRSFNGGAPLALAQPASTVVGESDGGALLGMDAPTHDVLERVNANGSLDGHWASGGTLSLPSAVTLGQLFPLAGGTTLMVGGDAGLAVPHAKAPAVGARIVRLTAAGKIDRTLGGPNGLVVPLRFGGADYSVGHLAKLPSNTFSVGTATAAIDGQGRILIGGTVQIGAYVGEGEATWLQQYAVARLKSSFRVDPSFGGPTPLRLSAALPAHPLAAKGVRMTLESSGAAVLDVAVRARGQVIAQGTIPCWAAGSRTVTLGFTRAGRRLRHTRARMTVSVRGEDLAGNAARASAH